jgi:hypothetical protein
MSSNDDHQSLRASSFPSRDTESLREAIDTLPTRSTLGVIDSAKRCIINANRLDTETQLEFSELVWNRLCAGIRRLQRNGFTTEKCLLLAASWICEVGIPLQVSIIT